jgi:purine-binding chemotaxis protein CheW
MSSVNAINMVDDPLIQWVTFKLADEIYGLDVMQVQEVLRYCEISPVPGSPSYVLGIINLRGAVVTVMDTRERFGLPRDKISDQSRILVIEAENHVIGMLVDSVAEVVYLRQSEIDVSPSIGNDESSRFIQGVCYKNDALLILVELSKMLSASELAELESIKF